MKKVVLTVLVVSLCAIMALSGCTVKSSKSLMSAKQFAGDSVHYSHVNEMEDLKGLSFVAQSGFLTLFSKVQTSGYNQYKVFDLAQGKEVASYACTAKETYAVTLRAGMDGAAFYTVLKRTVSDDDSVTYTYALCNCNGAVLDSFFSDTNYAEYCTISLDLIVFNDKVLRIEKNSAVKLLYSVNELSQDLAEYNFKRGNYYYAIAGGRARVYNAKGKLVYLYDKPSYAQDFMCYPLNNGNLYVRYIVRQMDNSQKYDIISGNDAPAKYTYVQQIIDVKRGKTIDLDNNYYIVDITSRADNAEAFNGIRRRYENACIGYEIVDKRCDTAGSKARILYLANNGKVQAVLTGEIAALTDSRYAVKDLLNQSYLYDYKGKEIGEITECAYVTDKYIVGDTRIFDMNLKELYDYDANGYQLGGVVGQNVLLTKQEGNKTVYYLYSGNALVPICGANETFVGMGDLYCVRMTAGTIVSSKVYTEDGILLLSKDAILQSQAAYQEGDKGYMLLGATEGGEKHYYLVG